MVLRLFLFLNQNDMKHFWKRTAFCAALLTTLCSSPCHAQTLVLHHADGTTTDVELFTQPRIQFEGDRVLITSSVLDMDYAKADILRFTYKGTTQAIGTPLAEADVSREEGRLVFHNVKPTDELALYRPNGVRVAVRFLRSGTDATLSLSQIPQGVYLLSVNGKTSKFTRP